MLIERYRLYLLQLLLRRYLTQGRIPTPTQINKELSKIPIIRDKSGAPLVHWYKDNQAEIGGPALSNVYNRFMEALAQDLNIAWAESWSLSKQQRDHLLRRLAELRMLYHHVRQLQHELDSILLTHKETIGYVGYAADNFTDTRKINPAQTTAIVDLSEKCITLRPGLPVYRRYPLEEWHLAEPEVQILTQSGLVRQGINLNAFSNILKPGIDVWKLALYYNRGDQEVTVDITISLPQEITLNYFVFTLGVYQHQRTRGEFFYSNDKYSWFYFPTGTEAYYLPEVLRLSFPNVTCRYIRIRLTREMPDNIEQTHYLYEFVCQEIQLGQQVAEVSDGVFVSQPLKVLNQRGQETTFNQVAIEVCESLPPGSDIVYEVSMDGGSSFRPISPLNRLGGAPPLVSINTSIPTSVDDISIDRKTDYPYDSSDFTLLSYQLPEDYIPETLQLWRNCTFPGQGWAVRQGLSGWYIDGQYYCCTGLVSKNKQVSLNLGPTTMIINGQATTGVITLGPGIYNFRCEKSFWSPLYSRADKPISNIQNVVELGGGQFRGTRSDGLPVRAIDPLYPYNHKLLLEGLPYQVTSQQTVTYRGLDLVAEALIQIVGLAELIHHKDCQGYHHAAVVDVLVNGLTQKRFLLRFHPQQDTLNNYQLERFRLTYQRLADGAADSVVLRATLKSGQTAPKLYYYIIKATMGSDT